MQLDTKEEVAYAETLLLSLNAAEDDVPGWMAEDAGVTEAIRNIEEALDVWYGDHPPE